MYLPAILFADVAQAADINLVFSAMGKGEDTIAVPCVAVDDDEATPISTPTRYMAQDMSATDSDVAIWQAMCDGDLPPLPEGVVWGVNGIIAAEDAMAALTGHLVVISGAGLDTPEKVQAFLAGALAGQSLKLRPEGDAW